MSYKYINVMPKFQLSNHQLNIKIEEHCSDTDFFQQSNKVIYSANCEYCAFFQCVKYDVFRQDYLLI